MKRVFRILVCLLFITALVLFFLSERILSGVTDRLIPSVVDAAEARGVFLEDVSYEKVGYEFPKTIKLKGAKARVMLEHYSSLKPDAIFDVSLDSFEVKAVGLFFQNWDISGSEISVSMAVSETFSNDEFSNLDLRIFDFHTELPLKAKDLKNSLKQIFEEVRELYQTGRFDFEYSLNGEIRFELNGVPEKMRIRSHRESGRWLLVANREDMKDISSVLIEPLTDAELDLFSSYPIQAPLILYYTKYAAAKSDQAYRTDRRFPSDAYRHLLWSFLLTKRFGPEFSERITDAHEIGATDNTEADHIMDYNNNDIGRQYVKEGVVESEILKLTLQDHRVIKFPKSN